jgi:hypothetical protein
VVNVGQPVSTPEAVILEQLDRFAAQVMPAGLSRRLLNLTECSGATLYSIHPIDQRDRRRREQGRSGGIPT